MPQVLILHFDAQQYRDRLAGRFPAVEFHAVHHAEEAEPVIADIEVIMGLGHHIPPPLIAKASKRGPVTNLTIINDTTAAGC